MMIIVKMNYLIQNKMLKIMKKDKNNYKKQ